MTAQPVSNMLISFWSPRLSFLTVASLLSSQGMGERDGQTLGTDSLGPGTAVRFPWFGHRGLFEDRPGPLLPSGSSEALNGGRVGQLIGQPGSKTESAPFLRECSTDQMIDLYVHRLVQHSKSWRILKNTWEGRCNSRD